MLFFNQTARVFTGPSSYSFQIQAQGRHFIRLYFFPFVYQSYDLSAATFTVSTQDSVLLSDFHPAANSSTMKEFSTNINRSTLILSFAPSGSNSLAFVNALEVVSVPDFLILDTAKAVNPRVNYQGLSSQVLQTVYRINMGGPLVLPVNDTLWRTWANDDTFLSDKDVTTTRHIRTKIKYVQGADAETAPDTVYNTARELISPSNTSNALFNMTWEFDMDEVRSSYLIRFHFCDIVSLAPFQLYFNVYVGSWLVASDFDLSTITNGVLAAAVFRDYVLEAKDVTSKILISISPSDLQTNRDGILNGLEIMKLNTADSPVVVVTPSGSKSSLGIIVGSVAAAIAVVIVVLVLLLMLRRRRIGWQDSKTWLPFSFTTTNRGSRTSDGTLLKSDGSLGYRISFALLQEATNNFDEDWVIGVGGFGKVYKGALRDGTKVAAKRSNSRSQQGFNEFRTEIEMLSRLRHRHLVPLIGYCDEKNEMILVYEYMEKGALRSHLYGSDLPPLTWKQRLEICIGAARGLHYLHTGSANAIIHRDVKSANIILDENFLAKFSDFGLSKTGPELDNTHVSTQVKGSYGYIDPEYFRRGQLTEKSDVYSFGVILLEVLCARTVIDNTQPRNMENLADWGLQWHKRGELDQIVDARIAGAIRPESLRKYGETIVRCLAEEGVDRPSMGDVLWNLDYVLQLQESDTDVSNVNSINRITELATQVRNVKTTHAESESRSVPPLGDVDASSIHDLSGVVSMSKVFSQLIKNEGR